MNNVFGARLRITSLRAPAGPGIELLEYLAPRDGRPMPTDSRADDLWAWQATLEETDTTSIAWLMGSRRYNFVSSGVIAMPDSTLGLGKALLVRDPDGHLIRLIQD